MEQHNNMRTTFEEKKRRMSLKKNLKTNTVLNFHKCKGTTQGNMKVLR